MFFKTSSTGSLHNSLVIYFKSLPPEYKNLWIASTKGVIFD